MDRGTDTQKSNLNSWTQTFLQARGLGHPDGRPLYSYRVSDQEFAELTVLLQHVGKHLGIVGQSAFARSWLLYAAEWWKRSYDGGAWAWSPVFDSLGIPLPRYSQIQQLVDLGCNAWRLDSGMEGGKRYIGIVATQGGLPLRLIESAHGNLSRLLRTVLQQTIICSLGTQSIRAEVEHLQHLLPHSYRRAAIYDLLTEVVEVVKHLHQAYALKDQENPVEVLNSRKPQWMDEFPLRVDGDSARQLLGGLIQEAAQVEQGSRLKPLQMRRMLRITSEGQYRLVSRIDVLATTTPQALADLFVCEVQHLPPSFQISLQIGDAEYPLADGVHRNQSIRLESRRLPPELATNTQSGQLRLVRLGETLSRTPLPGGDCLEDDMPWVFEDSEPEGRLLALGSVRLTKLSALLCVPEEATVFNEHGTCSRLSIALPGRALYRLSSGATRVPLPDGVYRVCCAEEHGDLGSLHWNGRTLDNASSPAEVYLGLPALFRLNAAGAGTRIAQGEFHWKVGSSSNLVTFRSPPAGMGTLLWKYGDVVQTRLNAVCLPHDAAIEIGEEHSSHGGTIWLKRWPALGISAKAEDYDVAAEHVGEDWKISIRAIGNALPIDIVLLIAWPGNQLQKLSLPFPGSGAVFFDAAGKRLPHHERLDVDSLIGTRLRLLPGKHRRHWEVSLTLRHGNSGNALRTRTYKYGLSGEIRLFEFMRPIREMLACTEMLDATVTIDALELNSSVASIRVGRYTAWLERDVSDGAVGFPLAARQPASGLESLCVKAVPIANPDVEETILKPARAEGKYERRWWFNPETREPGSWLIYPDGKSPTVFRPLIWDVSAPYGAPLPNLKGLRKALAISEMTERQAALGAVVNRLVDHPEDPDWDLLGTMVVTLGHLPLSGLDIWREFASSPRAMIMALLHLDGFAEHIAPRISEELPFEWLLTSPADWIACARTLKDFYQRDSGDRGVRQLKRIWTERRESMGISNPGVTLALDLAGYLELGITIKEAELLLKAPKALLKQLQANLQSEKGPLQSLLRRPGDDGGTWPTDYKGPINLFLNTPPARALFDPISLDRGDHKWSVIGFPVLLGFNAAKGDYQVSVVHTDRLHALRLYREFDPQWFDVAYRIGQILAFSTNLVAL